VQVIEEVEAVIVLESQAAPPKTTEIPDVGRLVPSIVTSRSLTD